MTATKQGVEDITKILDAMRTGDQLASESLLQVVYAELRRMANFKMKRQPRGQTIQATMLVHDAWLKLGAGAGAHFENRAHFFGAAAQAMRQILVDNAIRRRAERRGLEVEHVDIDEVEVLAPSGSDEEIVSVNEALDRLAQVDPRKAELVKLRYFVGLTLVETANLLGIAEPTASRDWAYARAWLHQDILAARAKNN